MSSLRICCFDDTDAWKFFKNLIQCLKMKLTELKRWCFWSKIRWRVMSVRLLDNFLTAVARFSPVKPSLQEYTKENVPFAPYWNETGRWCFRTKILWFVIFLVGWKSVSWKSTSRTKNQSSGLNHSESMPNNVQSHFQIEWKVCICSDLIRTRVSFWRCL